MLRAKSEVPTIIIRFIDLIFNQFDKKLRTVRSDNAKEYFRECRKKDLYPVCNYVSYDRISSGYKKIVQALLSTSTPRNILEAMSQTEWKKAMDEEMQAL